LGTQTKKNNNGEELETVLAMVAPWRSRIAGSVSSAPTSWRGLQFSPEHEVPRAAAALLKLLLEYCELVLQVGDLLLKCCDFLFQTSDALAVRSDARGSCFYLRLRLEYLHFAGEEMRVARFLGSGLPGKNLDEGRLALHQVLQAGLHGAEIIERMHAFGAGAKFAGRLRTAQEQNAEDSDFVAIEVKGLLEAVFVFGDAAVRGTDGADEGLPVQRMQRLPDGRFVEVHGGFAVGFLVAGIDEGV